MSKWFISFLLLLGAFVGAAQTASELDAPAVQRVAKKLLCSCGCHLDMTCLMPPGLCHVCQKGKAKIYAMQAQGLSDQAILHWFVQEEGPESLVRPPGRMSVIGPYLALGLGLGVVLEIIHRYRRSAGEPASEREAATNESVEKHLAGLDL